MITKEEYQRNLIRMFDSIRRTHKGEETCKGVECNNCPFYEEVCSTEGIEGALFHSYEVIEIVEQWAKEHPIVTNAMKFKEVFGKEIRKDSCVNLGVKCRDCDYSEDGECDVRNRFWNAEYNPTKEGEE